MRTEQNHACWNRIRIQRPSSLPSQNAINEHVVALAILWSRIAQRAVGIPVKHNLVEVEAHAPDRIVAKPVAAADRTFGVPKHWFTCSPRNPMQPRSHNWD